MQHDANREVCMLFTIIAGILFVDKFETATSEQF